MKDNFNSNIIESIVRMSNSLRNDNDFIEEEAFKKFKEVAAFILLMEMQKLLIFTGIADFAFNGEFSGASNQNFGRI